MACARHGQVRVLHVTKARSLAWAVFQLVGRMPGQVPCLALVELRAWNSPILPHGRLSLT